MATNLQFIKSAESLSTVSSISVTDCFNANYDVYEVHINKIDITNTDWIQWTYLDSGGSPITSALYDEAVLEMLSYASFVESRSTGRTEHLRGMRGTSGISDLGGLKITIFNPYSSSSYTFSKVQSSGFVNGGGLFGAKGIYVLKQSATHTGIKVTATGANMDNVTVKVYGVK